MNIPYLIEDTNLSLAWYRAMSQIVDNSGSEITPLVLTLTGFNETENFRQKLDDNLCENGFDPISTVSETIFPESLYRRHRFDRSLLYSRYRRNLARIQNVDHRNKKGTYFERLIAYKGTSDQKAEVNQLEEIISTLRGDSKVKRRSKLQASIFNPHTDHTEGVYQKFPCLQHVTFYKSDSGGLIINSFYAMQYLYQRAYGNWLGLINLGKFVARESGLELERFTCFVGVEQLDHLTKVKAKALLQELEAAIPTVSVEAQDGSLEISSINK